MWLVNLAGSSVGMSDRRCTQVIVDLRTGPSSLLIAGKCTVGPADAVAVPKQAVEPVALRTGSCHRTKTGLISQSGRAPHSLSMK